MNGFNIRALKKNPIKISGEMRHPASITIGKFRETFWIPLDYWSLDEYRKQWRNGIERLKTRDTSCLIERVRIDEHDLIGAAWVLYKVKDSVIFQYHFIPGKEDISHLPVFDTNTCYLYIRPRSSTAEEWAILVKDFFASSHAHSHPNKK
ncbi:hypothetical protein HYX58_04625 [Candidatus Dependentiae bacterium]|nr:hypothetical protein [Candidatus Dependentiae bacterium]